MTSSAIQTRDPQTPAEWREAVDAAEFHLLLDSARKYGLVTGGPVIDVARCEEILRRGAAQGYRPRPHEPHQGVPAMNLDCRRCVHGSARPEYFGYCSSCWSEMDLVERRDAARCIYCGCPRVETYCADCGRCRDDGTRAKPSRGEGFIAAIWELLVALAVLIVGLLAGFGC
jgi:hypothetical protein